LSTAPGIGIDVVTLARLERTLQRWGERFAEHVLGEDERRTWPAQGSGVAACFAVKEAAIKALGRRPTPFRWSRLTLLDAAVDDRISPAVGRALERAVPGATPRFGRWAVDGRAVGTAAWCDDGELLVAVAVLDEEAG